MKSDSTMSRRRKSNNSISLTQWILCGTILVICIAIGLGFVYWSFNGEKFDKATNCPLEHNVPYATNQLVVLVDVTDPLKPDVADRLKVMVENAINNQPQGTLVELFVLDDRITNYRSELAACVPKRAKDASDFTDNARMVEHNFKVNFSDKVDAAISRLVATEKPLDRSPICEMIKAVSLTSFSKSPSVTVKGNRKLMIFSDFMHHSPGNFTMYGNKGYSYEEFSHSPYGSSLTLNSSDFNLRGVEVQLFYTKVMTPKNAKFWEDYFKAGLALVTNAERI